MSPEALTKDKIEAFAFQSTVPSYFLTDNYRFISWNKAFEFIIAQHCDFELGHHAMDFVECLKDHEKVVERAGKIFGLAHSPTTDHEFLYFDHPKYGEIQFTKMAIKYPETSEHAAFWFVGLSINNCEQWTPLMDDLMEALQIS